MIKKRIDVIFIVLCVLFSSMALGCLGDDKEEKTVVTQQPSPQNVTYVQSSAPTVVHDDDNFWETMYLANLIGGNHHTTEVHYVSSPTYSTPSTGKTVNNYYSSSKTVVKDVKPSSSSSYKSTSSSYKPSTSSYKSSSSTSSYKPSTRSYSSTSSSSYRSYSGSSSYRSSGFRSSGFHH